MSFAQITCSLVYLKMQNERIVKISAQLTQKTGFMIRYTDTTEATNAWNNALGEYFVSSSRKDGTRNKVRQNMVLIDHRQLYYTVA